MGKKWFNKVTGITSAKRAIARTTGVPTTKAGRQQKVGRSILNLFGLGKKSR